MQALYDYTIALWLFMEFKINGRYGKQISNHYSSIQTTYSMFKAKHFKDVAWSSQHLKYPATRLCLVHANNKENTKAPHNWPFFFFFFFLGGGGGGGGGEGENPPMTGGIP